MNKLVIFDLDGVLFESRDMHYETLNEALEYCGFQAISREDHAARFNGLPTTTKLHMLGIPAGIAAEVHAEKQSRTIAWVWRNVRRNPTLVQLFLVLRNRGWKIAVASNAITTTVVRALSLLGLWELCDFVTAGDRGLRPKPAPDMYEKCMQVCEAEPARTIIVEDSPVGREGAAATGATVVMVSGPDEVDAAICKATGGK